VEIDDTVIEKPYSKELDGAGYVFSSSEGKVVFGYQVALLVWTNGKKVCCC
jgi:hypothetical protein